MQTNEFVHESSDGQRLACVRWAPEGRPKAIVQIAHGASEHAARYERVARRLTDAGYVVVADDHRGHGRTAADHGIAGVARPGGWSAMIDDLIEIGARARSEHPGLPFVLFGHSMGSMLAQAVMQRTATGIAAVVLSGSAGGLGLDDAAIAGIAALGEGEGAEAPSEVFAAMFGGFNAPFSDEPGATGFEWLSRDRAEVQIYVDDHWCGMPLSNGFVADMLTGTAAMWTPEAEAAIPTGVPIYVMSGRNDPVGGEQAASVEDLVARYESMGVGPIAVRIYEGARHELLNETNRDKVEADLVAWLDSVV